MEPVQQRVLLTPGTWSALGDRANVWLRAVKGIRICHATI